MSLVDHLRELRARLLKSVIAVVVIGIGTYTFYDQLFHLLSDPYTSVAKELRGHGVKVELAIIGSVVSPFMLQLKIAAYSALVIASPVWLYQIWAFVTPALHRQERKWSLGFLAAAVPLFLAGVALCYWALPKGIQILLEFTPAGFTTLTTLDAYLDFVIKMMLIFGIGFVLPVFVVLLNAVGVLPSRLLVNSRPWIILGIFVFAAVATPTGDPFNMCLVAIPITVLYLVSEVICRLRDRRRGGETDDFADLDDDEASPLTLTSAQVRERDSDERPSPSETGRSDSGRSDSGRSDSGRFDDEAT